MSGGVPARLLWTVGLAVAIVLTRIVAARLMRRTRRDGPLQRDDAHARFVIQQIVGLVFLVATIGGLVRIWFDDPSRFATIAGLATAGIAVALQRVITAFAAYLIILRGRIFSVGDRITIGGVRGDVVSLGPMQTSVMEMGEPPAAKSGDPEVWVTARQYTGRLIRVTNDKIFDTPVYNYTREFPYMWEELMVPVKYDADHARAESILLAAAAHHAADVVTRATPDLERMRARYLIAESVSLEPRVYLRLTDNWVELAVRFVVPVHGVRAIKDAMSREILAELRSAKIEVASGTYEIVGLPAVRVETVDRSTA